MHPYKRSRGTTSTIHRHLTQLQRKAFKAAFVVGLAMSPLGEEATPTDIKSKKGFDKLPPIDYISKTMSNTLAVQLKCKHCDKTFPTQAALLSHTKKVEAGKRGGYRKHRPHARFVVGDIQPRTKGNVTALDRLAEIRARKEQLLAAMTQTVEEEKSAMVDVQREYDEQMKKVAALSNELTMQRRTQIAVREEMEAHQHKPPEA